MDRVTHFFKRIGSIGTAIGSIFLAGIMLLIVSNIIARFFGRVVPGSYEMIELMIVVTVAFALAHAGSHHAHVTVDLIVTKLDPKIQKVIYFSTCLLSLSFWGATAWVAYRIAIQKGILETTDYFLIPYLPFRFVFAFGLFLLSVFFLLDMLTTFKRGPSK